MRGAWGGDVRDLTLITRDRRVRCRIESDGDEFVVQVDGADTYRLRLSRLGSGTFRLSCGGRSYTVTSVRDEARAFVHVDGTTLAYTAEQAREASRSAESHGDLAAPMPGTVTHVLVGNGDRVTQGQPLVIVEAMKMEHVIRAPRAARIRALLVHLGDQIEGGAVVARIDGDPDASAE